MPRLDDLYENYSMGFEVDGVPIPNPSAHGGSINELDSGAANVGRDLTGTMHRAYIATKTPFWLEYSYILFPKAHEIIALCSKPSFTVRYKSLLTGKFDEIVAYKGANLTYTVPDCLGGDWDSAKVSFKIEFIEY